MNNKMNEEENKIKGGVIIMGSLFWEDENAIDDYDDSHSDEEHRFALFGLSTKRLLFVSYTVRQDTVIRLISARKANQNQERFYNDAKK